MTDQDHFAAIRPDTRLALFINNEGFDHQLRNSSLPEGSRLDYNKFINLLEEDKFLVTAHAYLRRVPEPGDSALRFVSLLRGLKFNVYFGSSSPEAALVADAMALANGSSVDAYLFLGLSDDCINMLRALYGVGKQTYALVPPNDNEHIVPAGIKYNLTRYIVLPDDMIFNSKTI